MKRKNKANEVNAQPAPGQVRRSRSRHLLWGCGILLSAATVFAFGIRLGSAGKPQAHAASLAGLLALPPARLAEVPLAEMNLLSASRLCATNEPDLQACTDTLEIWAARVRSETERHFYRFRQKPAEFENSEAYFRVLMMAVVLAEDFGVHYSTQKRVIPGAARLDDGFFAEPQKVFLHGLLGPGREGTCSSLPVLYVALGRQLGYPLKLVTTKGHLFVRWETTGERFNVEATAQGLSRFDDEYYRHWPFEVSAAEEKAEGYLKSLTPPEELAVFLSIRGMCLREGGRFPEAAECFAAALKWNPSCRGYARMLADLKRRAGQNRGVVAHSGLAGESL